MQKYASFLLLFSLSLLIGCSPKPQLTNVSDVTLPQTSIAHVESFNKGWMFRRSTRQAESINDDTVWQKVDLPHTPKLEPEIVNSQWQGIARYQKSFNVPKSWENKVVLVRFEAAMNVADIWVNDKKVGHHKGGYLPFTLDITDVLQKGANMISVHLDNRDNEITGPKPLKLLDFNTYGGIYRGVSLLIKDKLMITDEMLANEVAGGGVFVTYPTVSKAMSTVNVKSHIQNQYSQAQRVRIEQVLVDNHHIVAKGVRSWVIDGNTQEYASVDFDVIEPSLWSPKSPHLYQLKTRLYREDILVEEQSRKIGIREFSFSENHELLINGEKVFLRGVNRHQEYPHVGYAISEQADYRDAVKIKSAGFDYVRLSHYPHSTAFMEAADELGLVILHAVLGWQYYNDEPAFRQHIVNSCADLIRRDRNHASVLAWECSLNESAMPQDFVAELNNTVKQEFPGAFSAGWMKGYDIYLQARQHRLQHYEAPSQPYVVSEYGDWEYYAQNAGLNQDSWSGLKNQDRTSRQLLNSGEKRLLQQALNIQEAHNDNLNVPAFADGYWVMFDYNRGYADNIEASGIMSLYRQPKYSYYFFASQRDADEVSGRFQSGPMVYIASEWTAASSTNIRVFSNADKVALYLNDTLISKQSTSKGKYSTHLRHPPFEFQVDAFQAGTLRAEAFINGVRVAIHEVTTPDVPYSLNLTTDISGVAPEVGVKDIIFVYAQVLDKHGNVVPINGLPLSVTLSGDIKLLNQSTVLTSKGQGALLIQVGDSLKNAQISVSASGLRDAIWR